MKKDPIYVSSIQTLTSNWNASYEIFSVFINQLVFTKRTINIVLQKVNLEQVNLNIEFYLH